MTPAHGDDGRTKALDDRIVAALCPRVQAAAIARTLNVSTAAAAASLKRLVEAGHVTVIGGPSPAVEGAATGTHYAIIPAGLSWKDIHEVHAQERPRSSG